MSLSFSPLIRFGTSTWTYEGWQGQVYLKQYAKSAFTRECLGEYCQYLYNGEPLFRTVGNDSTFYRPPTAQQLTQYLNQIPEDFEMCFNVWEEITIPSYANQPRYGPRAGQPNARFLDNVLSTANAAVGSARYSTAACHAKCLSAPTREIDLFLSP